MQRTDGSSPDLQGGIGAVGTTRVGAGAALGLCALGVLAAPAPAFGYHVFSTVTEGCHEDMNTEVLLQVREALGIVEPAPDVEDAALIVDAPFPVDERLADVAAVSLIIGSRYSDVRGKNPMDTVGLSPAHNAPENQREHCLRRSEHDEPGGTEVALEECRSFALEKALHAISAGVGEDGRPDLSKRTSYDVYLDVAGEKRLSLPVFHVYLGEALHVLQDSYSHMLRTPDHLRVTAAMNWSDEGTDAYLESRDGPIHLGLLDDCHGVDGFRTERLEAAKRASAELLTAALDPSLDPAQREAAVREVFARNMAYQPGCTAANRWCDAPELSYAPVGCQQAGRTPVWPLLALLALSLLVRRGGSLGRFGPTVATLALALGLALVPSAARAEEDVQQAAPEGPSAPALACAPGLLQAAACPAGFAQRCRDDGSGFDPCAAVVVQGAPTSAPATGAAAEPVGKPPASGFALTLAANVAIDKAAAAFSLGGRYAFDENWRLGLTVEWNPWASFSVMRFHPGVLNYYLTGTRRFPVNDTIAIRTSVHAGLSTLLYDVVGVRGGSTGLVLGVSLVGLDVRVARRWHVLVDPCNIVVPVPQLTGMPLLYQQYRFTVGVEYGN